METAVPTSNQVVKTFISLTKAKPKIKESEDKQQLIADLAYDPKWQALKELVIEPTIKALEKMDIVEPTDTVENIGFKALAVRLAVGHLKAILETPDQIRESLESLAKSNE